MKMLKNILGYFSTQKQVTRIIRDIKTKNIKCERNICIKVDALEKRLDVVLDKSRASEVNLFQSPDKEATNYQ